MGRRRRSEITAPFFHVVNRSVRQVPIFSRPPDYRAFLTALEQGLTKYPVRLLAYCVLGNHWHLIVAPSGTRALIRFMQWVTATHAMRWHRNHKTVGKGPVYQGRYYSREIDGVADLVRVCRYVERNALRAGLVRRAQDWPWSSLAERMQSKPKVTLQPARFLTSEAWIDYVNNVVTTEERIAEVLIEEGIHFRSGFGEAGSSGTETRKTVEKSSDPLDTAPLDTALDHGTDHPAAGEGREKGRRVRGRADQREADAHVERAKHLRVVDRPRALKPGKERRHRPALAVK